MTFQGITLVGNLLYGLLCVRLLPTADYSKFVVLFGIQGTVSALMDANLSMSLIPLIGERVHDLPFIADYVASLRRLSHWLYIAVGSGLIVFFPLLVRNRHWGWQVVAAMVATLLLTTWFVRVGATYGTVLILLRDRRAWHIGQLGASLGTLALLGLAWAFHCLNGVTAILFNVLGVLFIGLFYVVRARSLLGTTGRASKEKQKSIVRLALPNVPQAIFYALQGQVALLLITFFGRTASVASVGALSRLGAMFILISQMNPLLVEPYFAKLPKLRVAKSYVAVLLLAVLGCGAVTGLARALPGVFLWVLGPQYHSLHYEVFLAIASSSVSTLSGILWCIHSARRFVFWWTNNLSMALIFFTQLSFIVWADLSQIRTVLLLNLATNVASLTVNVLSGVYGFTKGPRLVNDGDQEAQRTLDEVTSLERASLAASSPEPDARSLEL